jgi:hypothetical protein
MRKAMGKAIGRATDPTKPRRGPFASMRWRPNHVWDSGALFARAREEEWR